MTICYINHNTFGLGNEKKLCVACPSLTRFTHSDLIRSSLSRIIFSRFYSRFRGIAKIVCPVYCLIDLLFIFLTSLNQFLIWLSQSITWLCGVQQHSTPWIRETKIQATTIIKGHCNVKNPPSYQLTYAANLSRHLFAILNSKRKPVVVFTKSPSAENHRHVTFSLR